MTSGVTDKLQIDLRFHLKALSESFRSLAATLGQAAKDLHDPGLLPSQQLLDELASARKEFISVRSQLLDLTQAIDPTLAYSPDKMVSLKDMVGLMQDALEFRKKAKAEEAKQQVLQRLNMVLRLAHKDKPDFAPLAECQAKARDLQSALTSADWETPSPELVHALVPFSALVKMVEQLDLLDDETLERLQDVTTPAFGKSLTIAASRGRLLFRDTAQAPVKAPETPASAPEAPPAALATPVPEAPEAAPGPAPATPSEVTPATPAAIATAPAAEGTGMLPPLVDVPRKVAAAAPPHLADTPPEEGPAAGAAAPVAMVAAATAELPSPEAQELAKLVTELYGLLGHKVERVIAQPDHDVDLMIQSSNGKKWIARCSSLEETVGETEVRNFYGVMRQEQAAQGAIITLGGFSPQARQWAKSNLLYLLDKKEFFDYLQRARVRQPDNGADGR
jgi:hypothetical protein